MKMEISGKNEFRRVLRSSVSKEDKEAVGVVLLIDRYYLIVFFLEGARKN